MVGSEKHTEKLWCAVTCLGKVPLILGHTWLRKHNSDIDWVTGQVNLTRCLLSASHSWRHTLLNYYEKTNSRKLGFRL